MADKRMKEAMKEFFKASARPRSHILHQEACAEDLKARARFQAMEKHDKSMKTHEKR